MDKQNIDRYGLYLTAFHSTVSSYAKGDHKRGVDLTNGKLLVKRAVFYGIKVINSEEDFKYLGKEEIESKFQFVSIVKSLIGLLTPCEFMNIFPIEKEYRGHKWEMKDYFYTRNYIKTLDPNEPIGENVLHFLWEYHNWEIIEFNVCLMGCISDLRQLDGKPSLIQEWSKMNRLKTYTMHTDPTGRDYLVDSETGKTARIKKKYPSYLKLV